MSDCLDVGVGGSVDSGPASILSTTTSLPPAAEPEKETWVIRE